MKLMGKKEKKMLVLDLVCFHCFRNLERVK